MKGKEDTWSEELKGLYPFLHGKEKDKDSQTKTLIESIHQKAADSVAEKRKFFEENSSVVLEISCSIARVYANSGRMFSMGNGGSSCDAQHFAVEFQHPVTTGRPSLPASCLNNDIAMVSAVANDVGFEHIFVRQLDAQAKSADGLIGFSTSGNSKNLLEAFKKAKKMGMLTIAITGGDGGLMSRSEFVDHCLVVRTDSIHRIQEIHVTVYHIVWDLVHTLLADCRGALAK